MDTKICHGLDLNAIINFPRERIKRVIENVLSILISYALCEPNFIVSGLHSENFFKLL
jgi:hypothetical protein